MPELNIAARLGRQRVKEENDGVIHGSQYGEDASAQ